VRHQYCSSPTSVSCRVSDLGDIGQPLLKIDTSDRPGPATEKELPRAKQQKSYTGKDYLSVIFQAGTQMRTIARSLHHEIALLPAAEGILPLSWFYTRSGGVVLFIVIAASGITL
jgi:hypothetical protein